MYVWHLQLEPYHWNLNMHVWRGRGGGKVKHNDLVEERISNHHRRRHIWPFHFISDLRCSYFTRCCVGLWRIDTPNKQIKVCIKGLTLPTNKQKCIMGLHSQTNKSVYQGLHSLTNKSCVSVVGYSNTSQQVHWPFHFGHLMPTSDCTSWAPKNNMKCLNGNETRGSSLGLNAVS